MSASTRHRRRSTDIWPGFVDALTSLIMVLLFMMLIVAIGQFVLTDALTDRDRSLDMLHAKITELTRTIAEGDTSRQTLEVRINDLSKKITNSEELRRSLDARIAELLKKLGITETERDQLKTARDEEQARATALSNDIQALEAIKRQLEAEAAQLLAKLNAATQDAEAKQARITDLDRQMQLIKASRVSELEKYRSEFFGKLRDALEKRDDIKVVGDRFVLPSDVLFDSGSAELSANAQTQLGKLVNTIRDVSQKIPENIEWVLRIDGHTDRVPIATDRFPSNWELSSARALAIVKYLVSQGIPAKHLSANGFGQYQPVDTADTPEARAKNRRIEFQLTNR